MKGIIDSFRALELWPSPSSSSSSSSSSSASPLPSSSLAATTKVSFEDTESFKSAIRHMHSAPEQDMRLAKAFYSITPPTESALKIYSALWKYGSTGAPVAETKTIHAFGSRRTIMHLRELLGPQGLGEMISEDKEAWFEKYKLRLKIMIAQYVNQFSDLIHQDIPFNGEDEIFNLIQAIVMNYDCILRGDFIPATQIFPLYGAHTDRIMVNIIKRVINIFLTVFGMNRVRVYCSEFVKERQSFVERVQEGYCETCAYSYDKTVYERRPSYPQSQSGCKALLFAAPCPEKYKRRRDDAIIVRPNHKFLKEGQLIDNSKYDIKFSNTGTYFISAHEMCKQITTIKLHNCGSIGISFNMTWACIMYAIEPDKQQAKLLTLHTRR